MPHTLNFFVPTKQILSGVLLFTIVLANLSFAADTAIFAGNNNVTTTVEATTDLTKLGRDGRLTEDLSLEADTLKLEKMLADNPKRQPIILDEYGLAGSTIVEQLALRISKGSSNAVLSERTVVKLEDRNINSGSITEEEAIERINSAIAGSAAKGNVILFVNNALAVMGTDSIRKTIVDAVEAGDLMVITADARPNYASLALSYPEKLEIFDPLMVVPAAEANPEEGKHN